MASQLTLDTKDPDIKTLVDGWADGREYQVLLTIRTGAGNKRNVCEVLDVEEEGSAEDQTTNEEPDTASEPAAPSPGAKAVQSAMGGMNGGMMTK